VKRGDKLHRPDTSERKHYVLRKETELSLHPQMLYAGELERSANWNETPHSHPFVEVIFVNSGRGLVKMGEEARQVRTGDVVVYNAGLPHNEISSADDPLEVMFFGARNISLAGLPENALTEEPCVVLHGGEEEANLRFYFTSLVGESRKAGHFSRELTESLTRIILTIILRLLLSGGVRQPVVNGIYVSAKTYIDAHFVELRSVEDLCRKIRVNRYYLTHLFKRYGDLSPLQCLTRKKIGLARELLAGTSRPVSEVASLCGFASETYFFRVFKAREKIPPRKWREEAVRKAARKAARDSADSSA